MAPSLHLEVVWYWYECRLVGSCVGHLGCVDVDSEGVSCPSKVDLIVGSPLLDVLMYPSCLDRVSIVVKVMDVAKAYKLAQSEAIRTRSG